MNFIRKNWIKISLLFYIFLIPVISFADGYNRKCNPAEGRICNPIGAESIMGLIKTLLIGLIKIGIPIVALAIIYCGFLFVEARGNSEKLTKAKDALLYTLIGAAILLGSWAIAQLIANTVVGLSG